MARQPHEYKAVHDAADKIEPRMAAAVVKMADRIADKIDINELAAAISSGSIRKAMKLVNTWGIIEAHEPMAKIVEDTILRGGRIGADVMNRELAEHNFDG